MIDPVVAALAGGIVTIAGLFYRHLLNQLAKSETETLFWRNRYFGALGRAEIATDQAVKRDANV